MTGRHLFKAVSIRTRLWTALTLLALSTMMVGVVAWFTLNEADNELENLHRQTLAGVASAMQLSNRSSDMATSAPFLLNLGSTERMKKEGAALLEVIDNSIANWDHTAASLQTQTGLSTEFAEALVAMRSSIQDLIGTATELEFAQDRVLQTNRVTTNLRDRTASPIESTSNAGEARLNWLTLQSIANASLAAGYSRNHLSLGENRRSYNQQIRQMQQGSLTPQQTEVLGEIRKNSEGKNGIFELRRQELKLALSAQNALFRIRRNANIMTDLTSAFAQEAEDYLTSRRQETLAGITFAKSVILFFGGASIILALSSAIYFSSYVAANINRVATAMTRLAAGDRKSTLPRRFVNKDEIGDLFRSFRTFRANALRLDRSNLQLHQRNALLEKVFNNMTDGVAVTDDTGRIRYFNDNFSQLLRISAEDCAGAEIRTVLTGSFSVEIPESTLDAGFRGTAELRRLDGQILNARANRLPDNGRVWLLTDVTESRQLDDRLNQIRRIEALGKVTGEVAHDFGNILSTVSTNLHLLDDKRDSKTADLIRNRIANAVEIGASLTQRLLAFAKKQQLVPETVELNSLVEGVADLVSVGLKDNVSLEIKKFASPIFVKVDPGQLESAIFNLCLNSNQAIADEGTIQIEVGTENSDNATITVSDTGAGMDEVTLAHAMEPFFTTRSDDEGTGLGLSMVYGFMKQTGGDIKIASRPNEGTRVKLSLRLCAEQPNRGLAKTAPLKALVVDDDRLTLEGIAQELEKHAFVVTRSETYSKGKELLLSETPYDLLVTDIQLEDNKLGWDLAEMALTGSPDTHVLVISGRLPRQHRLLNDFGPRISSIEKPVSLLTLVDIASRIHAENLSRETSHSHA